MQNSSLLKILRTLSKEEMREFGRFVHSPFHNGRNEVTRFYETIRKYYPGFADKNLTEEKVYSRMYPGKKYDDRVVRRLTSFLMKIAEEFLAYKRYRGDGFNMKRAFLQEAAARKLGNIYEKKLKQLENEYGEFIPPSEEYFLKKYYLNEDKINNFIYSKQSPSLSKEFEYYTQYLVEFLLILIFQNRQNLVIQETEFKADFSDSLFYKFIGGINFEEILKHLKQKDSRNYPVVALYYYQLMSVMEMDEEENISNFKKLLSDNINKFSWLEKRNFYYMLVSAYTLKIEKGAAKYKDELLDSYKQMLKLDICADYEGGYFSLKLFRNIVACGNIVKKYKWLKGFIDKYTDRLAPENRKNMYNLSMALTNADNNKHEEALENIMNIDLDIFQYKIDVRYLTVKTYYELDEYDLLMASIDSFKHFLTNDKYTSERVRYVYSNFCNLVSRLARIRLNKAYENLPSVKKAIMKLENRTNLEWLAGKAEELEKAEG